MGRTQEQNVVAHPTAQWIVLGCPSHSTLPLAESLNEAGIEAWTPVEVIQRRARRANPKEEVAGPIMPGYVFAREHHLHELLRLVHSPAMLYRIWDEEKRRMVTKGIPYFRFFKPFGAPELIRENQLTNLRRLDGLRRPKGPLKVWETGDRIRLADGAYAGLLGTVMACKGEQTTIAIDGWNLTPTVSTRLLHAILDESPPVQIRA